MSGPLHQAVRHPAVAGAFYPAEPERCQAAVRQLLDEARQTLASRTLEFGAVGVSVASASPSACGAIVPHAGWICSGAIAALAMAAVALRQPAPDVVVVFGAIHTPIHVDRAVLDTHQRWAEPGSLTTVAAALRDQLASAPRSFLVDDRFHQREHAVEVELPFMQMLWPRAMILPIETPPIDSAVEIGAATARTIRAAGASAVYLASSDLTHYGPDYKFTPAGVGINGVNWAMENDRQLLRIITNMQPEKIVPEVKSHINACGAGAIAAMMAACQETGAKRAVLLRHDNSWNVLKTVRPQNPDNAVGYAAVWVG